MKIDVKNLQKESALSLETLKNNKDSITQTSIQKFSRELLALSKKNDLCVFVFRKD